MDADQACELFETDRRIERALGRLQPENDGVDLRDQLSDVERAEQRLAAGSGGLRPGRGQAGRVTL